MKILYSSLLILTCAAEFANAEPAHDPVAASPPALTKQMRREMSDAFDKVTQCLRSDRAIDECRLLIAMAQAGTMAAGPAHGGAMEHKCSMGAEKAGMQKPKDEKPAAQHEH